METQLSKIYVMQQNSCKRESHSDIGLPQETRKISDNITYHLKESENNKAQSQQKERNNKDQRGNK